MGTRLVSCPQIRDISIGIVSLIAVSFLAGCATSRKPTPVSAPKPVPAHESTVPSLWPIKDGERIVTSPFGAPRPRGGNLARTHAGVDLKAPKGAEVVTTAPGVVTYTGYDHGGYGNYVRIQHDPIYETLYGHLSQIFVHQGNRVKRGGVIGKAGATGNATGPHLHYEVRKNGAPVDPTPYLPIEHER